MLYACRYDSSVSRTSSDGGISNSDLDFSFSFCQLDSTSDRFILGDIYGKLFCLKILRGSNGRVKELILLDLGDVSRLILLNRF